MGADDTLDDLEIFLGRRDETAHALVRFGDEWSYRRALRRSCAHFTSHEGQAEAERATIAVRIMRVHDAGLRQADRHVPR
jgi:hypothetical protein